MHLPYVDYEKAFGSDELNAALRSLVKEGIDEKKVKIVKEVITRCSTGIALFTNLIR